MKFAHIVALIVFGISFAISGGNMVEAVASGAGWGIWLSWIMGVLFVLFEFLMSGIFSIVIGVVVGEHSRGGGIAAGVGAHVLFAIIFYLGIASTVLGIIGYTTMKEWALAGGNNPELMKRGLIFLGASFVVSLLQKIKNLKFNSRNTGD